jgi:hypothetical protein
MEPREVLDYLRATPGPCPSARGAAAVRVDLNHSGRTASYKGMSVIHRPGDDGWDELKTWFFTALTAGHGERGERPNVGADYKDTKDDYLQLLDSPNRVIIETEANLVVGFDTARFAAKTAKAAAAVKDAG